MILKELKKCLKSEKKENIFDIVIFGSLVKGSLEPRDIDVMVIFLDGSLKERLDAVQEIKNRLKGFGWADSTSLRHAFVIWCVDTLRLDFDEVSKILGHSIMQTTQIYTKCRQLNLKRAIELCSKVNIIQ